MTGPRIATVFGGTGFLGHAVVQALAERGYLVRVPTRDPQKALDLKVLGRVGQVVPVATSVKTDASVAAILAGSDVVVNLIGILAEKGKNTFQSAHVETAARIARLSRAAGVQHLVHVSALGADMKATSRYARTKAVGEEAVRAFFREAVILRPSVLFGPRDKFLNRFAFLARFAPYLPLIGGGHTKFQPVYVGDVAAAILAAIDRPETRGRIYALGGPKIYSFRELMVLLLQVMKRRRWFISIPWWAAKAKAALLELMPDPILTRDQVELLKTDNSVGTRLGGLQSRASSGIGTLLDLGVTPTALESILPRYVGDPDAASCFGEGR